MAIDPKLYEKYSGRSGDPYKRLGEALSQNVKQSHQRQSAKDMTYFERSMISKAKMNVVWVVIAGLLGVVGLILKWVNAW